MKISHDMMHEDGEKERKKERRNKEKKNNTVTIQVN